MNGEQAKAIVQATTGLDPTQTPAAVEVAKELILALQAATGCRWEGWRYGDD